MNLLKSMVYFAKSLSIEPAIFLYSLSYSIVAGTELATNMLIWKVCRYELGFNETICENLDLEENDNFQTDVQRIVNNFQMVRSCLIWQS